MKLPPVAVIVLIVIAGLILLYLVARRIKPFGQSLGFVCAVAGRILVKIAQYMHSVADYARTAAVASLRYPPGVGEGDYWFGVNVLSRIVYFVLAVCILGGETVNTLLVLPALFHTANHFALPGIVDIASAALFICTPALFGAVILETVGLIPHGAGLFPRMNKLTRWVLGVLSGVFLILSILLIGYFYLYRAAYLADPASTQGMSFYLLGGLGLLIAAVSVLALWAFVVGGCGVASLLLWVGELIALGIAALASLVPSLLDTLALHLTNGTIGVYGEQRERDHHTFPSFPAAMSDPLQPGQSIQSLPDYPSVIDAESNGIVPIETNELEKNMSNPDKNATIVFVGSFGTKMFTPVTQKIATLRATESIASSAYLDLAITHVQTMMPGIVDLSPTQRERKETLLHSDTEGQAYKTLLHQLADRLVDTHLETKASPAPLIFVIDCHELVDAVEMLETIKRRLPLHSLLVVTSLSSLDVQNKVVQAGIGDMQRLYEEDVIETVMVIDPHYSFAVQYGEETQHTFLAHTLVGMVIAQKHNLQNRSFTNVLHDLHGLSPFTAVSFASEAVAVGKTPKRWAWVPGVSGHAGTGNYGDIIAQVREVINKVVTQENTRTFPASVHTDATSIVLTTVPIALNDDRFAACASDNAHYVGVHYTSAISITVRGNGCPYPYHMGSKYLVSAACLYPLSPVNFPKLQSSKSVRVTPMYPITTLEPTTGNGHGVANEQPIEAKTATGAPTTRQKKAAPARGGGRKNTRTAQ